MKMWPYVGIFAGLFLPAIHLRHDRPADTLSICVKLTKLFKLLVPWSTDRTLGFRYVFGWSWILPNQRLLRSHCQGTHLCALPHLLSAFVLYTYCYWVYVTKVWDLGADVFTAANPNRPRFAAFLNANVMGGQHGGGVSPVSSLDRFQSRTMNLTVRWKKVPFI